MSAWTRPAGTSAPPRTTCAEPDGESEGGLMAAADSFEVALGIMGVLIVCICVLAAFLYWTEL